MDKLTYLAKTLSRTKRKDYENYVINAVWNRLDCDELQPVSQQYFRDAESNDERTRRGYFIDLYFPQLNIGVECYEAFHEGTREHDKQRELTLIDILHQVDDTSDYQAKKIWVNRDYDAVEEQINACVAELKHEIERRKENGTFAQWILESDPREYFHYKDSIGFRDDIGFRTIADACNVVLGTSYQGMQRGFFKLKETSFLGDGAYYVWFPKLVIDGKSASSGWLNEIALDGSVIYEGNDDESIIEEHPASEDFKRITFVRALDPISGEASYRFAGIFELQGKERRNDKLYRKFVRVASEMPLAKSNESLRKLIDLEAHLRSGNYGNWIGATGHAGTRKNPYVFPWVEYDEVADEFFRLIHDVADEHPEYDLHHYEDVLEKNGLEWSEESLASADVSDKDTQCVLAMLLSIARAERFGDGMILQFLKEGHIQRWLRRLKELEG